MPLKDLVERRAYALAFRKANHARILAQKREHYWRNRSVHQSRTRAAHLRRCYGIDEEAFSAMLIEQGGVCAICGRPPKAKRLAVDHSHSTGKVRGLLCFSCNGGLGKFGDRADLLRAAAAYLEGVAVPNLADVVSTTGQS